MKAQRIFRASNKTPDERTSEQDLREKLQKEKPSLDDLVHSGECDSDAVMTMRMYFDLQQVLQALKQERERSGLSVGDVAVRADLDVAFVSQLENGKLDNPAVAVIMRYAAALGHRLSWCFGSCREAHTTRVVVSKYRGTLDYIRVLAELLHAAEYGGMTTYQDVATIMCLPLQGSHMGKETGHILGEISEDEVNAGRPMLSAIAVSVAGRPGPGFFELARHLGRFNGKSADEERFWHQECQAIYETWKRPLHKVI